MKAIDELEQMTQHYANYSNNPRGYGMFDNSTLSAFRIRYQTFNCVVLARSEISAQTLFLNELKNNSALLNSTILKDFNEDELFIKRITKECVLSFGSDE